MNGNVFMVLVSDLVNGNPGSHPPKLRKPAKFGTCSVVHLHFSCNAVVKCTPFMFHHL